MTAKNVQFIIGNDAIFSPFLAAAGIVGLKNPPDVSFVPSPTLYANLTLSETEGLISDFDEDVPAFLSASTSRIIYDFGVATEIAAIAILNHNCFYSNDYIKIYAGDTIGGLALVATLTPKSGDLFYPLRFNDAWIAPIGAPNKIFWAIEFHKDGGTELPFVGEIVIAEKRSLSFFKAFDVVGMDELSAFGRPLSYDPNNAVLTIQDNINVRYKRSPEGMRLNLSFVEMKKPSVANIGFAAAMSSIYLPDGGLSGYRDKYKQVFIFENERTCLFGRIDPNFSESSPDGGTSTQFNLKFSGELPRRIEWIQGV